MIIDLAVHIKILHVFFRVTVYLSDTDSPAEIVWRGRVICCKCHIRTRARLNKRLCIRHPAALLLSARHGAPETAHSCCQGRRRVAMRAASPPWSEAYYFISACDQRSVDDWRSQTKCHSFLLIAPEESNMLQTLIAALSSFSAF